MLALGLLLLLVTFLSLSLGLVLTNRKHRDFLLGRLGIRRHRTSGSYTPPRSISPNKKDASLETQKPPDYSDVFPPSRFHALAELGIRDSTNTSPSYEKRLPSSETALPEIHGDHVTATGFSLNDISRLGDFPDYATLSGVPLPSPYTNFDITQARPRPYRPLRWAYHQTMCKQFSRLHRVRFPLTRLFL